MGTCATAPVDGSGSTHACVAREFAPPRQQLERHHDGSRPTRTFDEQFLYMCEVGGRLSSLELLYERGASIYATDSSGQTAFDKAIMSGNLAAMWILLNHVKIKSYPVSKGNRTLLMTACAWSSEDTGTEHGNIFDILILNRPDEINAVDDKGWTALMYAFAKGKDRVARTLLHSGASVHVGASNDGRTLAHFAAENGSKELCEILSNLGVDVNAVDNRGVTPLMLACASGELTVGLCVVSDVADRRKERTSGTSWSIRDGVVNMLLDKAKFKTVADVHATDNNGLTALSYASYAGCWRSVVLLMNAGADANVKDNFGRRALDYAYAKRASDNAHAKRASDNAHAKRASENAYAKRVLDNAYEISTPPDLRDYLIDPEGAKRGMIDFDRTVDVSRRL